MGFKLLQEKKRTYFLSSIISAIIVLITPILLFNIPPKVLNTAAVANERENPKPKHDMLVPSKPIISTLFLPIQSVSASRPQKTDEKNCAAVKQACSIPAWAEIVESGSD